MIPDLQGYLARGWSLFPCEPHGKAPDGRLVPHGLKQASADPRQIEEWLRRRPDANWAVRTGRASGGLFVIDIDGDEGAGTILKLQLENEPLPLTLAQHTGSGAGWQLFFIASGLGNSAGRLGVRVDTRCENGYALIPPSVTKKRYAWVQSDAPIAPLPRWLRRLLELRELPPAGVRSRPIEVTDRYIAAALQAEMATVASAPAGARNHTLNRSAFGLARFDAHLLPDKEIFAQLMPAARSAGLSAQESARTIMSALHARRRSA